MAALSGWALALLCLFSLVYGLQHVQLGVIGSALYVSLGHTAWGLALAWIVVACCTGYGGQWRSSDVIKQILHNILLAGNENCYRRYRCI